MNSVPDVKRSKRIYRSERRRQQAASTQSAIGEAAKRLFAERGYTGTTIEAIAENAGVAAVTVYSTFGTKRALLAHLVSVAVAGDDEVIPFFERPGPRQVLAARDQRAQVRLFAADISGTLLRVAPLMEVASQAARTEPEITELLKGMLRQRLANIGVFATALRANGPLKDDLSAARAAEIIWAVTTPEAYLLTQRHLDWSHDEWISWLGQSLADLLLP